MGGWVYIMASKRNGTIYVGVTSDLYRRTGEHKEGGISSFTKRYGCKMLVWYERHFDIEQAIQREKSIKRYLRIWKIRLIEFLNPEWDDLYSSCCEHDNLFDPVFVKRFEEDWSQLDPQASSSGTGPRIQSAPDSGDWQ